jgi:hypothetical protein
VFGLTRQRFHEAMAAEGIPSSSGYVVPLYRQPLFANRAFGPYTGYQSARPNFEFAELQLEVCERICGGEGSWLTQNLLLGTRTDMEDITRAMQKVYDNRQALAGTDMVVRAGA